MAIILNREEIRDIVCEIRSYHPATQFIRGGGVYAGTFDVRVPGGATSEQQALITLYREEIYWYLTTPPDAKGQCWRGHEVSWVCTSGGIWLCLCYYWTPERVNYEMLKNGRVIKPASKYRNYWTKENQTQAVSLLASDNQSKERIPQ